MRRLVLYAHWDAEGKIRGYVRHTLRALADLASEIRFISTAKLLPDEAASLDGLAASVTSMDNLGFDFSMWAQGLKSVDLSDWDEIVLVNSSVLGPVFPLKATFQAAEALQADVWGLTENPDPSPHVQSYFLVFRRSALDHPAFRLFWSRILPFRDKNQTIRAYEVGLTHFLQGEGLRVKALYPSKLFRGKAFLSRHRARSNATLSLPEHLLNLGCPFVKAELIRDNPMNADLDRVFVRLERLGYPFAYLQEAAQFSLMPESKGIRRVPKQACPVCGHKGHLRHQGLHDMLLGGADGSWNILYCPNELCGTLWVHPSPMEEDLHLAYRHYYTSHPSEKKGTRPLWMVRKLSKLFIRLALRLGAGRDRAWLDSLGTLGLSPGRLLEVGCGSGERLARLKNKGWEAVGQDVDPEAVAHAREAFGLDIRSGPLVEQGLPQDSFDHIALSHVLEHVKDPSQLLAHCWDLLKPGGRIFLVTPNGASLTHRRWGRHYVQLDPPRHLCLYTQKSLGALVERIVGKPSKICTSAAHGELFYELSRDVARKGWTAMDHAHTSLPSAAYQLLASLWILVDRDSGDELCVEIQKPRHNL